MLWFPKYEDVGWMVVLIDLLNRDQLQKCAALHGSVGGIDTTCYSTNTRRHYRKKCTFVRLSLLSHAISINFLFNVCPSTTIHTPVHLSRRHYHLFRGKFSTYSTLYCDHRLWLTFCKPIIVSLPTHWTTNQPNPSCS